MAYFTTRPKRSSPESPRILTGIVLCGTLLSITLTVESYIFYVQTGRTDAAETVEAKRRIANSLSQSLALVNGWVDGYIVKRRALVQWENEIEIEFIPPRILGYRIKRDNFAGDGFLGNTTETYVSLQFRVPGDAGKGLTRVAWNGTKAAGEIRGVVSKWKGVVDTPIH